MTKKDYCTKNPAVAYYSGFGGLEIHGFDYGIDDFVYCVSGAWSNPKNYGYHKLKIHYDRHGNAFFRFHGYKCMLSDCIRMGV